MIDEAKKRDLHALEDLAQEVERDRERTRALSPSLYQRR